MEARELVDGSRGDHRYFPAVALTSVMGGEDIRSSLSLDSCGG